MRYPLCLKRNPLPAVVRYGFLSWTGCPRKSASTFTETRTKTTAGLSSSVRFSSGVSCVPPLDETERKATNAIKQASFFTIHLREVHEDWYSLRTAHGAIFRLENSVKNL